MDNVIGPLGFNIPTQSLENSSEVTLTPPEVTLWCKNLVITDFGNTTRSLFHAISDCNKVNLSPKDRLDILELFSQPFHFIHYTLNKHFIHQHKKLTKQQLIIADLAKTLQIEMANGYKLVVEQSDGNTDPAIFSLALHRIIFHTGNVIIHYYHLYTAIAKNTWKELHLAYKIAEEKGLQTQHNLEHQYKKILLLAAANPYHWNQHEQTAFYRAAAAWANLITLQKQIPSNPNGIYIIELNEDRPPMLISGKEKTLNATSRILDLSPILGRISGLLATIEPNELKAKITHNHEAEYTLTIPLLKGLLKEWGTSISRLQGREEKNEKLRLCSGFKTTHYYVNGEQEFKQSATQNEEAPAQAILPTITVQEVGEEEEASKNSDKIKSKESDSLNSYPIYECVLVDEAESGYGLLLSENTYPPIQSGELVGIERTTNAIPSWEIGRIRWLQHRSEKEFRMGIEVIAKHAKAGGAQLVEEGKGSGFNLRALLLESSIILPILPFKPGHQIIFSSDNGEPALEMDLNEIMNATGSYKQFSFKAKHSAAEKEAIALQKVAEEEKARKEAEKSKPTEEGEGFDSIWSHL